MTLTNFMKNKLLLILFCCISSVSDAESLCKREELVVFSCDTDKAVISYCATVNTMKKIDKAQFRMRGFDTVNIPPAPASPKAFSEVTRWITPLGGGHIYTYEIAMHAGATNYSIMWDEDQNAVGRSAGAYVVVDADDGTSQTLDCKLKTIRHNLHKLAPFITPFH